jgi:hypothetical protein
VCFANVRACVKAALPHPPLHSPRLSLCLSLSAPLRSAPSLSLHSFACLSTRSCAASTGPGGTRRYRHSLAEVCDTTRRLTHTGTHQRMHRAHSTSTRAETLTHEHNRKSQTHTLTRIQRQTDTRTKSHTHECTQTRANLRSLLRSLANLHSTRRHILRSHVRSQDSRRCRIMNAHNHTAAT